MDLDRNRDKAVIELSWVCSNCGSAAAGKKEITGTKEADVKGTRLFTWDEEKKREKAESEVLENKLGIIEREAWDRVYRTAEFDCKCPACGDRPPWARFAYSTVNNRLGPFCFLATMLLFMIGFEKFSTLTSYSPMLRWAFLVPALIYGIWVAFRFFHRSHYEKKLKELDPKHLPVIKMPELSPESKTIRVKRPASVKNRI